MRTSLHIRRSIAASLLCAGALLLLSGCYRHVVGVKGPGAATMDVTEANIQPGESFWEEPKPRPVEVNPYNGSISDRPVPTATTKAKKPPE